MRESSRSPVNLWTCSQAINCPSAVDSVWMGGDERRVDRCVAVIWLGFLSSFIPRTPLPSNDYRARRKFSTRLWCESLTGPACPHRPRHHAQANRSSDITWRLYCNTVMEISRLRFKRIILGNLGVMLFSFKSNYKIFSFIGFNNQIQKMTACSEGI